MITRWFCVGLFGAAGVSGFLGCAPEGDPLTAPFVTIVRDLSTVWDQDVFCVSPYEWYTPIKRHPPEVLERIVDEGFHLLDWVEGLPDTSANVLTMSWAKRDSMGLRVAADVAEYYIYDGKLCGGSKDWTYILDCDGPDCTILHRWGPGSSTWACDSLRPAAQKVLAGQGQRCPPAGG